MVPTILLAWSFVFKWAEFLVIQEKHGSGPLTQNFFQYGMNLNRESTNWVRAEVIMVAR